MLPAAPAGEAGIGERPDEQVLDHAEEDGKTDTECPEKVENKRQANKGDIADHGVENDNLLPVCLTIPPKCEVWEKEEEDCCDDSEDDSEYDVVGI